MRKLTYLAPNPEKAGWGLLNKVFTACLERKTDREI